MLKTIARLAIAAVAIAAAGAAGAQTVLKMAHVYVPGNIWYESAEAYAKAVEQRSGGKVKIQIAHSGTTGDWPQSIEGLKIGTNDIVLQSIGTLDRYGTLAGIEAYPYLMRDVDQFKKVYFGPVGAALFDDIAKKTGFRIVGAGYRGARHLTNNKRIEKLADLRGVKLRVPPLKMYRMTWEMLGASPVPMGPAELFTSMQQGVVDGQENPLEWIESNKYNEVQKYVVETGHILGAMTWIFSEQRFRQLPPDVQQILKEEGEKVMLAYTDRMVRTEGEIKARLQAKGMTFIKVDTAPWQATLAPMAKEFPELADWVQKIQAVR